MMYLLKWAVSNTYKSLSFVYNDIVCNLYFKIELILTLLLEAGDIEINPDPYTSNNSLLMLHSNIRNIGNILRLYNRKFIRF